MLRGPLRRARGTHGPKRTPRGPNLRRQGQPRRRAPPHGLRPADMARHTPASREETRATRRVATRRGRHARGQDADGRARVGAAGREPPLRHPRQSNIPGLNPGRLVVGQRSRGSRRVRRRGARDGHRRERPRPRRVLRHMRVQAHARAGGRHERVRTTGAVV